MSLPRTQPLHALERPASGQPAGLVILLHGVGAQARSVASLAQGLAPDLAVVIPNGPLTLGPEAYAWFPVVFGADGPRIDAAEAEASRQQLLAFLQEQQQRLGVSPERTVVAGFSQGGIMSASVALTAPTQVHGFGLIAGRILPEIAPLLPDDLAAHAPQGLILHGRRDDKLPFSHAEASAQWLSTLGVPYAFEADDVGHTVSPAMHAAFLDWVHRQLA